MKTMTIRWQRLVDEKGLTCDRCGDTGLAVEEAYLKLKNSMPLGIDVVLKKETITTSAFSEAPLESNRIWIGEKPLEEWLGATTGQSQCCSVCGDNDCRTTIMDGVSYEAIPTELIVKAGLIAGSELIGAESSGGCCPSAEPQKPKPGCGPGCNSSGC